MRQRRLRTRLTVTADHGAPVGTFVERYRASDFFAHPDKPHLKETPLAAGTQYNYRLGLDLMRKLDMISRSFADLTPNRANLYIKMVKREHGGAAAAQQKTLLSNLWKFARGFADFNGGGRLNPMKHADIEQPCSRSICLGRKRCRTTSSPNATRICTTPFTS